MKRHVITPRTDWIARVEAQGFTYHSGGLPPGGESGTYWDESVCYEFTLAQVERIEAATEELHRLCLGAVDHIVTNPGLIERFGIPKSYHAYVLASAARRDPSIMGRFDLAYDPVADTVKMLEYNADTPTLVIETAIVQWTWLEDTYPDLDQFNSLHDKLIARYGDLKPMLSGRTLHFSSLPAHPRPGRDEPASVEEFQHVIYFQDLAIQAGLTTKFCAIPDVGYLPDRGFYDQDDQPIRFWAKLYPWEWLAAEQSGVGLPDDAVGCLEPVWKMLLSNKAILPILWGLNPGHPLLLPAAFEEDKAALVASGDYVRKPILAREGANMLLARSGQPDLTTDGSYASGPMIYQARATIPAIDGHHVVIGSWIVGEDPVGMILREDTSPLIVGGSKVVPHYFVE